MFMLMKQITEYKIKTFLLNLNEKVTKDPQGFAFKFLTQSVHICDYLNLEHFLFEYLWSLGKNVFRWKTLFDFTL